NFLYTRLTGLKKELTPAPPLDLDLPDKARVMTITREYEADIIKLFHASGDFNYRPRWQEGVRSVEEVSHFLPRVGMRRRNIMEKGNVVYYGRGYSLHHDRIEFVETDEKKRNSTSFTLEKMNDKKVKLTINYYLRKNFFNVLLFRLTKKKKMIKSFQRSLD